MKKGLVLLAAATVFTGIFCAGCGSGTEVLQKRLARTEQDVMDMNKKLDKAAWAASRLMELEEKIEKLQDQSYEHTKKITGLTEENKKLVSENMELKKQVEEQKKILEPVKSKVDEISMLYGRFQDLIKLLPNNPPNR